MLQLAYTPHVKVRNVMPSKAGRLLLFGLSRCSCTRQAPEQKGLDWRQPGDCSGPPAKLHAFPSAPPAVHYGGPSACGVGRILHQGAWCVQSAIQWHLRLSLHSVTAHAVIGAKTPSQGYQVLDVGMLPLCLASAPLIPTCHVHQALIIVHILVRQHIQRTIYLVAHNLRSTAPRQLWWLRHQCAGKRPEWSCSSQWSQRVDQHSHDY